MFLWIYLFTTHVLKDITLELLFRIRTKADVYPIDFTHSCVWTSCPNTSRIFYEIASFHVGQSFRWTHFWIIIYLWSSLCIIASAILYANKLIDVILFRFHMILDIIEFIEISLAIWGSFGTFMSSVSLWDYHGVFYTSTNHLISCSIFFIEDLIWNRLVYHAWGMS